MIKKTTLAAVLLGMGLLASRADAAGQGPTSTSMFTFDGDVSAGMSGFVQGGSREFITDDSGVLNVSLLRFGGRISTDIAPCLAIYGGAGWAQADMDRVQGEGGLAVEAGLLLNFLEYRTGDSVTSLKAQTLGLSIDTNYSWWQSNFESKDMSWGELTVTPQLVYVVTRGGDISLHHYDPQMAGLRTGFAFVHVDGTYGNSSLSSNRDFGAFVAGDVMLRSDWIVSLDTTIYGGSDRLARILIGRYF